MGDGTSSAKADEKLLANYKIAIDERKLELNLFWQRSVFFWGFIASAFIAYAALKDDLLLRLFISCFGIVCSLSWTLANRGSKYWYEAWEQKVNSDEFKSINNHLYNKSMPVLHPKRLWSGRMFSVTRLAIGLSDFTTYIWGIMFIITASRQEWHYPNWAAMAAVWGTIAYIIAIFRGGRFSG